MHPEGPALLFVLVQRVLPPVGLISVVATVGLLYCVGDVPMWVERCFTHIPHTRMENVSRGRPKDGPILEIM